MMSVTLEIAPEVYHELQQEAGREGKPVERVAYEWLKQHVRERHTVASDPLSDRDRFTDLLRSHGLLVEPTSDDLAQAESCSITLDAIHAAFANAGGPPVSEIVIAQRGPKL